MPPKVVPPANWRQLYTHLEEYRKDLTAPVDTVGCHMLKDRTAPLETQRFHTLVALMLSAQTKDTVTAVAMAQLLEVGLTPDTVAAMPAAVLDEYIGKVGFHNNKTKYIKQVADILRRDYDGRVPRDYKQVIALPGVGPKMAHLYFQAADGQVLGIGVDTHVHRISQRFQWVPPTVKSPEDTRKVLESWLPTPQWATVNHLLVGLGQTVCTPLNPKCGECKLNKLCPNAFQEKARLAKAGKAIASTRKRGVRKVRSSSSEEDDSDSEKETVRATSNSNSEDSSSIVDLEDVVPAPKQQGKKRTAKPTSNSSPGKVKKARK